MEDQERVPVQYTIEETKGSEAIGARKQRESLQDLEAAKFKQQLVEREAQLQGLASALLQAEERERRRIAQGLHDQIGQILALVKRKLGALQEAARASGVEQQVEEIQNLINQAIQASRSLTFELSSPVLYELGLDAALQSLGEQLAQQHHLCFHFQAANKPKPQADDVDLMLYRVARELLFNVIKHARARNVWLEVRRTDDHLQLNLFDDGVGFDAAGAGEGFDEHGGFGLFSIRQQLDHIGGRFEIDSAPGDGTHVMVVVPFGQ